MSAQRVAVIGIGNLRCGPPIVGALATTFGERPLEIRMYDPDPEMLELFDRLARVAFVANKANHHLVSTEDLAEALQDAERVILCLSDRSLQKRGTPLQEALCEVWPHIAPDARILSLIDHDVEYPMGVYHLDGWPATPSSEDPVAAHHRILRWVLGDESVYDLTGPQERGPLQAWLSDPTTATFVST